MSELRVTKNQVREAFFANLEEAFKTGKGSDVTVKADCKSFPVHSFVLKTQSPVFMAMMESKMQESASKCIDLGDQFSSSVVNDFLHFLYVARFPHNSGLIHGDLFYHLEFCSGWRTSTTIFKFQINLCRYQVDLIMDVVEKRVVDKLSVENCIQVLKFADLHSRNDLRDHVLEFVTTRDRMTCLEKTEEYATLSDKFLKMFISHLIGTAATSHKRRKKASWRVTFHDGSKPSFVESDSFAGPMPGYDFKNGDQGLGYYLQTRSL